LAVSDRGSASMPGRSGTDVARHLYSGRAAAARPNVRNLVGPSDRFHAGRGAQGRLHALLIHKCAAVCMVVICFSVLGCDDEPASASRIGVRLTQDGSVEVLLVPCDNERITEIVLSDAQVVERTGSDVLWKVTGRDLPTSFVLGQSPAGARTEIPLQASLDGDTVYSVLVQTSLVEDMLVDFAGDELSKGSVKSQGSDALELTEFMDKARATC
jgi:hypothetical protein